MSITMGMQYTIDLDAPLYKMPARTLLVEGDKLANALVVEVVRGKEPVDLAGLGVTGEMIRTGEVMPLTGSISGNTATLTLPQACYAVPGGFELQMRLVNTADGITRTILILSGKIERKGSGTIIDVGEVVPNLDDLLAQIDAMKQATAAAQNVVSQYDSKVAEQDGKISQLSEEIENRLKDVQDAFAVEVNSGYITPGGTTGANTNYIYSALMETKPGDMWLYEGKNSGGGLSVVWGYSSLELENPTALVPAGTIDGYAIAEVPEGIYYIRAQALSKANTARVVRLLHGKNVFFYSETMGSIREFFAEHIVNPRQSNQYKVYVLPGVYNFDNEFTEEEKASTSFVGVIVPEWTTIEGFTTAKKVTFSCTLSSGSISTLNLSRGSSLKNVTVLGENCRYAIHDDFGANNDESIRYMSDCIVQATNCSYGYAYGGGCRSGQQFFFERCVFRATNYDGGGFLMHSNTGFVVPALVVMNNCEMYSEEGHPERACNFRGIGNTSVVNKAILNNCKCDGIYLEKSTVFDWEITGGGNSVCPTATSSDCKLNFADAPYTDTTYTANYFNALDVGSFRFADGIPQWWDGTKWVKADGSAV